MKKLYIVANWKSNLTKEEARKWFEEEANIEIFIMHVMIMRRDKPPKDSDTENNEIIICPPFTLLSYLKTLIEEKKVPFKLGAQNVSSFDSGAYTGEINAKQIKDFGDYVIIGHSERRNNFGENDDELIKKVRQALVNGLMPIFCIQNETTPVPDGVKIVAYEPPSAIGTGNPDTPENAEKVAEAVKSKYKDVEVVLYGGSVTSENIKQFVDMENINGVLVGGASLDPVKFAALMKNAS